MQLLLTLIEQYGLWLVFAAVLVEQLGMPLPAYPVLVVTGAVSARGDYSVPEVIAVAMLSCLIADLVWYSAGARLGRVGVTLIVLAFALLVAVKAWQRHAFRRQLRMARVSVGELNRMLAEGNPPLVVDVRSSSSRLESAIPGSIWVDMHALDRGLDELPVAEEVIVYCACPNEASAALVAKRLIQQGFKRVRPLTGGLDAWVAAGYQVESRGQEDYET